MGSCIRHGSTTAHDIIEIQPVLTARVSTDCSHDTKKELIACHYSFGEIIGAGSYGRVRTAHPLFKPVPVVAVKSLKKTRSSTKGKPISLKKELDILQALDYPNVVRFYESFEDSRYIHIVTEYCRGGSLEQRILENGALPEDVTRRSFISILRTVHYLHTNHVCHRDIKASNFLYEGEDLKLIDFGLSARVNPGETMQTKAGTPYYMAPEVLQGQSYTHSSDLWSVGVLLYYMLHGTLPFLAESRPQLFDLITEGQYTVAPEINEHAKDLLAQLLTVNPKTRVTAERALRHPWLVPESPLLRIDSRMLAEVSRFFKKPSLDQVLLKAMAKYLSNSQTCQLKKIFLQLDPRDEGCARIGSLQVRYTEFIAGNLHRIADQSFTRACFTYLDVDKDDQISSMDLLRALDNEDSFMNHGQLFHALSELDDRTPPYLRLTDFEHIILYNSA